MGVGNRALFRLEQNKKAMKTNDILLAYNHGGGFWYFLQVIRTTEKPVTVRQLFSKRSTGMPCPNNFADDDALTRKVRPDGTIRLSEYAYAQVWDGKPLQIMGFFGMNQNLY